MSNDKACKQKQNTGMMEKQNGGELIKEATSSKYTHHVIPVILNLCLAVKSVIATTSGFFRWKAMKIISKFLDELSCRSITVTGRGHSRVWWQDMCSRENINSLKASWSDIQQDKCSTQMKAILAQITHKHKSEVYKEMSCCFLSLAVNVRLSISFFLFSLRSKKLSK